MMNKYSGGGKKNMKIEETNSGNIKIVMNKEQTLSLYILLNQLSDEDYIKALGYDNPEEKTNVISLWDLMQTNKYLYV